MNTNKVLSNKSFEQVQELLKEKPAPTTALSDLMKRNSNQ